jgi:hypothetical protein
MSGTERSGHRRPGASDGGTIDAWHPSSSRDRPNDHRHGAIEPAPEARPVALIDLDPGTGIVGTLSGG